jgi:Cu/Zn superoxide dismutase
MNPIQLDTSAAATDTIAHVATDQSGLTSTTTRTVIIHAANDNQAPTTPTATSSAQ